MRWIVPFFMLCCTITGFAQDGGLGSYLSRTTSMAVRAETLKADTDAEVFAGWLEGLIVTSKPVDDSLYGFVHYDVANSPDVIGFRLAGVEGQQTIDIRRVNTFSFLEEGKKYIRYFQVVLQPGKKPDVLEKVVEGEISYWKRAKVYHYGSRSSGTVTIPKLEYEYYLLTKEGLEKIKNFKKQIHKLSAAYQVDTESIVKEKGLKLSDPVHRAMLVYHVNEAIAKAH
ncbi:MAG: hypothetical protein AAF551_02690 [Bacteroidota bacterium]